jgi:hypothetical protein
MNFKFFFLFLGLFTIAFKAGYSENNPKIEDDTNKLKIEVVATDEDSLIFEILVNDFRDNELILDGLPLSEYIIRIGICFLRTPYVASTLEINEDECLVINLREMDCTTFVEYVTALALCFSAQKYDFSDFVNVLTNIRYRSGKIAGYASRLHYFSDWLQDNKIKGIINIVSDNIGNDMFDNKVNFMTSNSHLYKQLVDTTWMGQIKIIEADVSSKTMKYITKDYMKNIENKIYQGDIIALASSIKGLDISHVGFAIRRNGRLHLLHASSLNKKVEISSVPLDNYLNKHFHYSGILIGRVKKWL